MYPLHNATARSIGSLSSSLSRLQRRLSSSSASHHLRPHRAATLTLTVPDVPLGPGKTATVRATHCVPDPPHAPTHTPLVLIGGTSQTVNGHTGHVRPFLESGRSLFIYETRGQGKTTLSLQKASLDVHARDFAEILKAAKIEGPVDVCGFSFGGRVALAIAAEYPQLVRRLVVTGVASDRGAVARCILRGWHVALEAGSLEAMAWSSVVASHSEGFVRQHEARVGQWVQELVKANSIEGVLAIVSQTHVDDLSHPLHTLNLARKVTCPTLLLVGEEDRLAPPKQVKVLAETHNWEMHVVPHAGHMLPIERPIDWRRLVLDFLTRA